MRKECPRPIKRTLGKPPQRAQGPSVHNKANSKHVRTRCAETARAQKNLKQSSRSTIQQIALGAAVNHQLPAQDTSGSVWVAASAGAGKTRVLTSRLVRLLLEGADPSTILALTYTRAAAKEMTGRVIEMARTLAIADEQTRTRLLADILGLPGDVQTPENVWARAASLYERILETPGGLAIQTIHAFCQSLLGRFPFEAGLAPGFEPVEDPIRQEILDKACTQVLAEHDQCFPYLKAMVRPNALTSLAQALVRIDWDRMSPTTRLAAFDQTLGGGFSQSNSTALQQTFRQQIKEKSEAILALANQARQTGAPTDKKLAKTLEQSLRDDSPLDILAGHFLTGGQLKARGIHTKALNNKESILDWLLNHVPTCWTRNQLQKLYDVNVDLLNFGSKVAHVFAVEKARRAVLDFDDLIKAAGRLFSTAKGPTYVQYRLDRRLEHILVDEAQDTSAEQWQVIAGLAEPLFDDASHMDDRQRTLFVVGDFKQSIYSFQGAVPQLFEDWRNHFQSLAGDRLRSVSMVHSFRSSPDILTFVDQIACDLDRGGLQIESQPLPQHQAVQVHRPGLVQVWPAPDDVSQTSASKWEPVREGVGQSSRRLDLGRALARHIHRLCFDPDWARKAEAYIDGSRRVVPGDFLVLVQQRRPDFANAFIGTLKSLQVPVTGVDRLHLKHELIVQDLLALGDICLQPEDDLALAALLKSPLFGYSEDQLFDLAYDRGSQSLMKRLRTQSPEIAEALSALASRLGRVSVYDFYASYLFTQGGRQRLLTEVGPEADEVLSVFLDRARLHDRLYNGDLLRFIESERQSSQDLKRDSSVSQGQVRLMTVHGAKGLEAPIVILPDLQTTRSTGSPHIEDQVLEIADVGPVWVPHVSLDCPQTTAAKKAHTKEKQAERERLFYVALTRAQERLIICTDQARQDQSQNGQWSWYNQALRIANQMGETRDLDLLDLGWPVSEGFVCGHDPDLPTTELINTQEIKPAALPAWLGCAPPTIRAKKNTRPSTLSEEKGDVPILAPTSRKQALKRGTLMHAALEHLPTQTPDVWHSRIEQFFVDRAPGMSDETRAQWVEEVLAALENPDLRLFFGPDSQAEVGVTGKIDGHPVVGQIDRLHVDRRARVVRILDYKTNRPPPRSRNGVAPTYQRQLQTYRELIQPLYPNHQIRTYLFWTHTAYLMDMTEVRFKEEKS